MTRRPEKPLRHRRRGGLLVAASLLSLTTSGTASAATDADSAPDAGFVDAVSEVDPVVVTATRTAETADATLAPVSVVTREDIERSQARSTLDLLRGLPGISMASFGGPGRVASLYLRGTNPNQVLFLVDGIKVGSATTGQTEFQNLPVDQIERIEVVRGPRSSLYGSEAAGGVVQVFTRRGGGPLQAFGSLSAGRYQTAGIAGGIRGGGEQGRFSVAGNFDQSRGFDACAGRGFPYFDGCGTDEPDADGYTNQGVSASAGYDVSERFSVDASFLRAETDVDYDGAFQNEARNMQQVAGLTVRLRPLDLWDLKLSAGRSWDEQRNFRDGAFASRFDTRRDSLSLQNDLAFGGKHLVTAGVDYLRDMVASDVDYAVDSRDNIGVFGEYQGWFGPAAIKASLRYDDNEQFGGHTTGDVVLGFDVAPDLRITAAYGTAFTAPTFNDLYYPGDAFFAGGNPDLEPEESRSAELGFAGRIGPMDWSLNLFETHIDDLITLVPPTFAAENLDRARIRGLEAVTFGRILATDISANLTLLDPRNESAGADDGNLLARRPEQTFRLDLDRRFGRVGLGASFFAAGRRFDDPANSVRLDGYSLLDLRASYAFSDALQIQARLENVFDQEYETVAYYNQPGRGLYVTLRYAPD
ncbi:MAG: TonB-dependent vitamin B12 receptor [Thiohalocapsa sp.]|jgi:vitamin B12 transporter